MRNVRMVEAPPQEAVRLVGVLAGEPLEDVPVPADTLAAMGFRGEPNQTLLVSGSDGPLVLVGLGDEVDAVRLREACGAAARAVSDEAVIATTLHRLPLDNAGQAVLEGLLLGSYRYDRYKSQNSTTQGDICLVGLSDQAVLDRTVTAAEAVYRARDWVNSAPQDKSPADLAAEMAESLTAPGMTVEVWDEGRIAEERLGGLIGVAAGSDRPPRMLVARRPVEEAPALALVGKGIVFDSGGLSIKPADAMETMKSDMAGAAAVVSAAAAIAVEDVPVDLRVYVPLTDNMSSGSAIKPGDVLRIRNGKTIEVLNTDAEGRLVLADALSLAVEEQPDMIVDLATLTGAARVSLGDRIAAVFASDDSTSQTVLAAAEEAGERAWPMPLPADYRKMIDSSVADMKNTGGRYGGAILAASLLAEFTGGLPWAHIDIAGPSFFREDTPLGRRGGSGYGVTTLMALANRLVPA
ncbi:MAG TPA: leucyl aminopeptidase [Acidimicrobiia bacterium]|nr:leucyl aminopeptidase [Acidimicrobiia bacterium]